MTELHLTKRAKHDLDALPRSVQEAVLELLGDLERDSEVGKQLRGRLRGLWSARVGLYRVLYTMEGDRLLVRAIKHRAVAYGRRRR
ncbi:MAG: type II toxin-antitoxin system RelE/ParE family toxin [Actinobacteria bacterium]|nr:type II toxin-antitoxin system RelE/ParE family toxin [Actinomycetota bacterium]